MSWGVTRWNVQQQVEMGYRAWNDAHNETFESERLDEYAIYRVRLDYVTSKIVKANHWLKSLDLLDFLEAVHG
jgi:hypothetical protein